jgi:hypothetical protein
MSNVQSLNAKKHMQGFRKNTRCQRKKSAARRDSTKRHRSGSMPSTSCAQLIETQRFVLLASADRAATTSTTQFLHDLGRRVSKRAECAQQARIFASPLFVFSWKHAGNPKRFDKGSAIPSEQIDHLKLF